MVSEKTRKQALEKKKLGKRLQRAREEAGLSKQDVQLSVGIPAETLRAWEHGRNALPAQMLAMLAALYRVSADCLLGLCDGATEDGAES